MFELCMMDLDDTLLRTEDLKEVREACKNNAEPARLQAVHDGLIARGDRHIYSLALLQKIRAKYPALKMGVFTRSPRSYTAKVLQWAYPGFNWDIVVAYEDVKSTKPSGEGLCQAMEKLGIKLLNQVMMVGDSDVDVRAAYNCGCFIVLDRTAWPFDRRYDHWNALGHLADAVISSPDTLLKVLDEPEKFLPELERLLARAAVPDVRRRLDKINHFIPKSLNAPKKTYPIHACGRYFANKASVSERRRWHPLTLSIEQQKEADEFPTEWIEAVRRFITGECISMVWPRSVKVLLTVVPHRPGRKARLENFLVQFSKSVEADPINRCDLSIGPDLLAYEDGVKSQHHDQLNQHDRFVNVRDHLYVKTPDLIAAGTIIVVIDDVCTTGASLIYATEYLQAAGAANVKCLALAKNVGDVLK